MTQTRWTLKSIAQKLGVSTATISNAFNRPDQLSRQRREAILKACQELGYFGPNKAARSLRRGQSGIVALVLSDSIRYMVSDPVASQFVSGASSVLEDNGKSLLLVSGSQDDLNEVVDFVDGFICYGTPRNPRLVAALAQVSKKVVVADFTLADAPSVNIENWQGAYEIARLALQGPDDVVAILGLRLLSDSTEAAPVAQPALLDSDSGISYQRLKGYQQAIEEVVISQPVQLWNLPESNQQFAAEAAAQALSQQPRPTVLLCMSDVIALSAMTVALKMGLRIPEDLRVVGFDGIAEAQRFHPTLTTVHQYSEQKGRQAAAMLLSDEPVSQILPYELWRGDSA